jgi:hypothetical protein
MYLMNMNETPPAPLLVWHDGELISYIEAGQGRVGGLLFSIAEDVDWSKDEGVSGTYAHEFDLVSGEANITFAPRDESPKIIIGDTELVLGAVRVWRTIEPYLED